MSDNNRSLHPFLDGLLSELILTLSIFQLKNGSHSSRSQLRVPFARARVRARLSSCTLGLYAFMHKHTQRRDYPPTPAADSVHRSVISYATCVVSTPDRPLLRLANP